MGIYIIRELAETPNEVLINIDHITQINVQGSFIRLSSSYHVGHGSTVDEFHLSDSEMKLLLSMIDCANLND